MGFGRSTISGLPSFDFGIVNVPVDVVVSLTAVATLLTASLWSIYFFLGTDYMLGALLFLLFIIWKNRARRVDDFRGAPFLPIVGHSITFLDGLDRAHDLLKELFDQHGSGFCVSNFSDPPLLFYCDPKTVEHVAKTNFGNWVKGEFFYNRFLPVFGKGIFAVDGALWQHQRKTASHMFTDHYMAQTMTPMIQERCVAFVKKLEAQEASDSSSFDLSQMFFRFTFDTFVQLSFGKFDHLEPEELEKVLTDFMKQFDLAQQILAWRFISPMWKLSRVLGVGIEGDLEKARAALNRFAFDIVERRREKLAKAGPGKDAATIADGQRKDLLTLFLTDRAWASPEPLSNEYLRDILLNFVIAGRDTTAQCLSWMFYELDQHPAVTAKMVAEIDRELGGRIPTFDEVKRLEYIKAVMNETLRLHPSVPVEVMFSKGHDTLPDGRKIKPGYGIVLGLWVMGRNKDVWGADAEEFRPERWEEEPEPSDFKFFSFKAGRRKCLGKPLAYLEVQMIVAMILQRFAVVRDRSHTVTYNLSITLPLRDGMKATLKRRTDGPKPVALAG